MRVTLLQPPYPEAPNPGAARRTLAWMRAALDDLRPHAHDLVVLPEYANAPHLTRAGIRAARNGDGAARGRCEDGSRR